jgi:hypothetical protein
VIAPQPGDLEQTACEAHTVRGPIRFSVKQAGAGRALTLRVPEEIEAELILEAREKVPLPAGREPAPPGCLPYRLPKGETATLSLMSTFASGCPHRRGRSGKNYVNERTAG